MKYYKKDHLKDIKTYHKIEKHDKDKVRDEISRLNKYYKNKNRENALKIKDYYNY